ncbi:MAG: hypothetical protein AAFR61_08045 [Bacteroidota bacterium]
MKKKLLTASLLGIILFGMSWGLRSIAQMPGVPILCDWEAPKIWCIITDQQGKPMAQVRDRAAEAPQVSPPPPIKIVK